LAGPGTLFKVEGYIDKDKFFIENFFQSSKDLLLVKRFTFQNDNNRKTLCKNNIPVVYVETFKCLGMAQ